MSFKTFLRKFRILKQSREAERQFNLASLYLSKGRIEQAIQGYRKVLEFQPDHRQAILHLDHLLSQQEYLGSTHQKPDKPKGRIFLPPQKPLVSHRCG
jgi:tetratricopeptide (TPR) repeat protein